MAKRKILDKVLYRACEECIADAGKENDELVGQLYDYMYKNYDEQRKRWNYDMIDDLIKRYDNGDKSWILQ